MNGNLITFSYIIYLAYEVHYDKILIMYATWNNIFNLIVFIHIIQPLKQLLLQFKRGHGPDTSKLSDKKNYAQISFCA